MLLCSEGILFKIKIKNFPNVQLLHHHTGAHWAALLSLTALLGFTQASLCGELRHKPEYNTFSTLVCQQEIESSQRRPQDEDDRVTKTVCLNNNVFLLLTIAFLMTI